MARHQGSTGQRMGEILLTAWPGAVISHSGKRLIDGSHRSLGPGVLCCCVHTRSLNGLNQAMHCNSLLVSFPFDERKTQKGANSFVQKRWRRRDGLQE